MNTKRQKWLYRLYSQELRAWSRGMYDLKYLEAAAVDFGSWPNPSEIQFDAPREIFLNFRSNALRALNLCALPGFTFWQGVEWGNALATAYRELNGDVIATLDLLSPIKGELLSRTQIYLAQAMNIPENEQKLRLKLATSECEKHMVFCGDEIIAMLERQLQSIVIQSWTAFEVLCGDLLKTSISSHPECFPHLTGSENFTFRKREPMRSAYKAAFKDDVIINNVVSQQCVDAMCILRNLLVHKAGVVDHRFKVECSEAFLTGWAALPERVPFECTGEVISDWLSLTIKTGCSLVKSVDKWLIAHKP